LKWGEDQLHTVKGRELRRDGMWSTHKGSEVEWGVGVGEMFVTEYCKVWFTHCLLYPMIFNIDSSTLGSTLFWVWIVYNTCSWFFGNFEYWVLPWVLYVILCVVCYSLWCVLLCVMCVIVLYCTVFYCIVLQCTVLYCTVLSCLAM
jgi:hypothetical protein